MRQGQASDQLGKFGIVVQMVVEVRLVMRLGFGVRHECVPFSATPALLHSHQHEFVVTPAQAGVQRRWLINNWCVMWIKMQNSFLHQLNPKS
jgi:hypothetical protein